MIRIISLETVLYEGYCIERAVLQRAKNRVAEIELRVAEIGLEILELKQRLYEITPVEEK